jgi:hypothetical protein
VSETATTPVKIRFKAESDPMTWRSETLERLGIVLRSSVPTRDTWNGYPVLRLEELSPQNYPFESEADDGDYFRA